MIDGAQAAPPRFLHQLAERSAQARPDALALIDGERTLTHRELDRRANALARRFCALGLARGERVALRLPRSAEFAVGVLAILKAGGAFVPIDPEWPAERRAFVLRDAGVRFLLTDGAAAPDNLITLDVRGSHEEADAAPLIEHEEGAPAYVIYTSGSTGAPKGVLVEHRAIVAHLLGITRLYALYARDRGLFFHSVAFDPAIEQLFGPLLAGGCVVLRGEELPDGAGFSAMLRRHDVTVATLPAGYWLQLLRDWEAAPATRPPSSLRLVIVGGEALPPAAVALWRSLGLTSIRLLNDYGPTEATITATVHELPPTPAPEEACGRVPIGRPHGPVEVLILDDDLRPVPPGGAGELCLGGPTLARGYLGHEALTAARFVPHPLRLGARIYRTGDRARFHPDGSLDFLGRLDDQVKVRGHRVEPGEIEAALGRHPAVAACAVALVARDDGDGHLAAFLVPRPPAPVDRAELRTFLAGLLPPHAVPSTFEIVEALPLTTSGKVDRRALANRPVVTAPPEVAPPDASPAGIVARAWREALALPALAPAANVFEHGASSLTVAEVHRRLQQALGRRFGVALLFEHTSIRALAAALSDPPRAASTLARARAQRAALANRRRPATTAR